MNLSQYFHGGYIYTSVSLFFILTTLIFLFFFIKYSKRTITILERIEDNLRRDNQNDWK